MRSSSISFALALAAVAAVWVTACSSVPPSSLVQRGAMSGIAHPAPTPTALLIGFDLSNGTLVAWPMQRGGGRNPQPISGPLGLVGGILAANGNVIAIASDRPPLVTLYDVVTKNRTTLKDPNGTPIDIAIGKDGSIYALNFAKTTNVTVYPAGSPNPLKLGCGKMSTGEEIAVDNEGDVFVNGYRTSDIGVVEFLNGPNGLQDQNCTRLDLNPEVVPAGLAIDPKTDDLITLDNPDECAGGIEGLMTIYPKPYQKATGFSKHVGVNCSGGLRLSADSSIVFVGDEDVSGTFFWILQRSFPDGKNLGVYHGGNTDGMTTLPNTLPN